MKPENKVYSIVTEKILALLEKNIIPWKQSWDKPLPQNPVTHHTYNGFNRFYLYCMALEKGYTSPLWVTYNNFQEIKGKNGRIKPFQKPEIIISDDFNLKYFSVYNLDQTEGAEPVDYTHYDRKAYKNVAQLYINKKTHSFYSKEELIQELTIAFLSSELKISNEDKSSCDPSYKNGWLHLLKNNPRAITEASKVAQEIAMKKIAPLTN